MALHRKWDALLAIKPDIAIISETANPDILHHRGLQKFDDKACIWMGKNPNKGLGVFAFNGFGLSLHKPFYPYLNYILPVHVSGPVHFNLLAVWAQNASAGITRKHQMGPLRRGMGKYDAFLRNSPSVIAGDLNNNKFWDKKGWRCNHMTMVEIAAKQGLHSVYHATREEEHGAEREPTHYWRDRIKDGPTYHIDYIFASDPILSHTRTLSVGTFEDWCGNKLSDHVPLIWDVNES